MTTLIAAMEDATLRHGQGIALRDATSGQHWTYEGLHHAAMRVAAGLRLRGVIAGDRVVLMYSSGLDFAEAVLGCLYAGCIPVPVAPIGRQSAELTRLEHIVADCGARVAMSTESPALLERVRGNSERLRQLRWFVPSDWEEDANVGAPVGARTEDVALLQYTSGSTGDPCGVVVTHGALASNVQTIFDAMSITPEDRGVSWLPLHHDMGLVGGLFGALWARIPLELLPARRFVADPLGWLQTISKTRATISGGPNFAYRLCADRAENADLGDLDLRSWRIAFCGSEPVDPHTMTRFCKVFEPYGLDPNVVFPCYGMAEATLYITGRARGDARWTGDFGAMDTLRPTPGGEGATTLTSCGRPRDCSVRIVDEGASLEDRRIGEIWVTGPSMAKAYYGKPEKSARQLRATLQGDAREWVRTGDLGFLDDGQLYVTGRQKEVLIVAGRNLYPQDLERTLLDAEPMLRAAAAFEGPDEAGGVVCLVELNPRAARRCPDTDDLCARLRRTIAQAHGLSPVIEVVPPRTIQVTSSGKVRRRATRADYARVAMGRAKAAAAEQRAQSDEPSPVERRIMELASAQLGAPVSAHADFYEMGIDSITATQIMNEVAGAYGIDIGLDEVADALTIRDISTLVERRLQERLDLLSDEQIKALLHANP